MGIDKAANNSFASGSLGNRPVPPQPGRAPMAPRIRPGVAQGPGSAPSETQGGSGGRTDRSNADARKGGGGQSVSRLAGILTGAFVSAPLAIMLSASHAALIFPPQNPGLFAIGFQMALLSTVVVGVVISLFSSIRGAIPFTQDVTAVSISVMCVAILAALPGGISSEGELATLLTAIVCATFACGLFFFIVGRLRLGKFIRFAPLSVVGGFLAATGCLIIKGGLGLVLPEMFSAQGLKALSDVTHLLQLGGALVLAAVVATVIWRLDNLLVAPVLIIATIGVFHLVRWAFGLSIGDLASTGWLVADVPQHEILPVVLRIDPDAINWPVVLQQFPLMMTVLAAGTLALLMNASALELSMRRDVDLNLELEAAGAGNLLASMIGGIPGYTSISGTVLNCRLGGNSRAGGIIVAALGLGVLLLGSRVLQVIPLPVLAGLLVWVGSGLVYDWLYRAWFRVSFTEYIITLVIVLVVVFAGMLEGVVTGLIAGIVLFVVDYSRIEVIKTQLTGRHFNSRRVMPESWRDTMRRHGGQIVILKLQGFIFFGTAHQLVERIHDRLERENQAQVRFLVMDFRHINGIDSSAVLSFIKLERMAGEMGFTVVLTNLDDDAFATLRRGGVAGGEAGHVRIFENLDSGLQWCEDELIASIAPRLGGISHVPIQQKLFAGDASDDMAERMLSFMDGFRVEAGTVLLEQGSASCEMYFIESGSYSVVIDRGNDEMLRISTLLPGAVAGEVAFYMGRERTASVVCEEAGVIWRFSRDNLEHMRQEDPQAANYLHERMSYMLAERLISTTRLVQHLAD